MPPENDEDSSSSGDIPTFGDLVERLEDERHDAPASRTEPEAPDESEPSFADLAGSAGGPDSSKWQWGGGDVPDDRPDQRTEKPGPSGREEALSAAKADALLELIDEAANVLVVGPAGSAMEFELCAKLCTRGRRPRRRLLVTTRQSPDERLTALRSYGAGSFDETTVIAVGDDVRSSGGDEPTVHDFQGETITVETIRETRDLTRLGLLINQHLPDEVDESAPVLCFHNLTTLLQFVEIEKAFRFLHVLQGRVRSAGAQAHYHIDPNDHAEAAVHTLEPLFDFTVRFDADGHVSVDS